MQVLDKAKFFISGIKNLLSSCRTDPGIKAKEIYIAGSGLLLGDRISSMRSGVPSTRSSDGYRIPS